MVYSLTLFGVYSVETRIPQQQFRDCHKNSHENQFGIYLHTTFDSVFITAISNRNQLTDLLNCICQQSTKSLVAKMERTTTKPIMRYDNTLRVADTTAISK